MNKMERSAWAAGLVAVVIWGASRGGETAIHAKPPEGGAAAPSKSGTRLHGEGLARNRVERVAKRGTAHRTAVKGNVLRSLHRGDPLDRMADFLAILSSCDERDIGEVEAAWKDLKAAGMQLPAEELLLNHRLGQLKGAAVLEGHTGTAADFASIELLKSRFDGWLVADPFGAKAWLEGLPAGKFRDQMAMSVIAASARDNPVEAMQQVASLPGHLRQTAGITTGARLSESLPLEEGSQLLVDLGAMGGNADEEYLKGIFDSLAGAASQGGGKAVSRLIEDHLGQAYVSPHALERLTGEIGKSDPVSALEWASGIEASRQGLSGGELRSATVRGLDLHALEVAEEWASDRPEHPGVAMMQESLQARRRTLEDRGDDENEYDKDD